VKHRFSDVQSIRGAHNAPGTGFYLYDSNGQPSVSFVFDDQQTAADALEKMRNDNSKNTELFHEWSP
jgi:hypothetical protein